MKKIGLLSDTHGFIHKDLFEFFKNCDEIWHAGDIGNAETALAFEKYKPFRAVFGNIDGTDVRAKYPLHQHFTCEQVEVWITHIGGYPGKYAPNVRNEIIAQPPQLFISGHSHILKVIYDKKLKLLHINPGAAGKTGMHQVMTAVRFEINGNNISNLEIIELGKRSECY